MVILTDYMSGAGSLSEQIGNYFLQTWEGKSARHEGSKREYHKKTAGPSQISAYTLLFMCYYVHDSDSGRCQYNTYLEQKSGT